LVAGKKLAGEFETARKQDRADGRPGPENPPGKKTRGAGNHYVVMGEIREKKK